MKVVGLWVVLGNVRMVMEFKFEMLGMYNWIYCICYFVINV